MSDRLLTNDLFSDQQRAWLGGFVYGLTGIRPDFAPPVTLQVANTAPAPPEQVQHPWHDWRLPIVDRMELATGKPVEQRLMAAMAQLDCGSCGYMCQTYGQAIADGQETNLTLCAPGGKDTKRMIKQVLRESPATVGSTKSRTKSSSKGWTRQRPFKAKLIESRSLNRPGSAKDTRHIVIDLQGSGLTYQVGDALGVYPTNCPELAAQIVQKISADPRQTVVSPLGVSMPLAQALLQDGCLKDPSDELLELLIDQTTSPARKSSLHRLLAEGVPEGCDVLDVLTLAGEVAISGAELVERLDPLNPRLYSIASSMKQVGDEVHLTVGKVTYHSAGRLRKGVASTMLADRVARGARVRVFVQPNHSGFTLPASDSVPLIMVGPGTGIAPFRGFLQERAAKAAPGKNWLFFGDQHAATDFLYQKELERYLSDGLLTRLETAFSRDGDTKEYVQDRMQQHAAELWQWLCHGAYFFVCGDASRMARDVHQALIDIVAQQAGLARAEAIDYVEALAKDGRYVRDVY